MNIGANDPDASAAPEPASADWATLGADWRAQVAPKIDVDALRREAGRRGRHLRWALTAELLVTAFALGMLTWAALRPGEAVFSPVALVVVAALLLGGQGWSLWIRRRQVRDSGLDARALLQLERDRIATSLGYWRINVWVAALLWVGMGAMLLWGLAAPTGDGGVAGQSPPELAWIVLANLPVLLGSAVFGWWWCRRSRVRLARLRALQDAMDDG